MDSLSVLLVKNGRHSIYDRRISRITWTREETGRETRCFSAYTIQAAYAPASGTDVLVDSAKKEGEKNKKKKRCLKR